MTEQELMQLIEQVEQESLHKAPDYLDVMILHKAEQMQKETCAEIISIHSANLPKRKSKRFQLFSYNAKIVAAVAVALIFLMYMPSFDKQEREYTKIEWQQEQLEEMQRRKEEMQQQNQDSVMLRLNQTANDICNKIYESTNQLFKEGQVNDEQKK